MYTVNRTQKRKGRKKKGFKESYNYVQLKIVAFMRKVK